MKWSLLAILTLLFFWPASSPQAVLLSGAPTRCWNTGPDGWTVLCPTEGTGTCNASATGTQTGTCFTAVSTSGNNTTCTSATTQEAAEKAPCLTIAKGISLVRNNSSDWLLLKKGDTWTDEEFSYLCVSGKSANAPILISSYGTGARPLLQTDSNPAIGSFGGCPGGNFIALVGLEFYAYKRDPDNPSYVPPPDTSQDDGTRFLNSVNWLLIEDMKISWYRTNASINIDFNTGGAVIFRRNVILNAYAIDPQFSQGVGGVSDLGYILLEENLFSNNGWNADIVGAERTQFSRNAYLTTTVTNIVARGNISTYSASEGFQFRTGGIIYNNLSVQNSNGFDVGHQQSDSGVLTTEATVTYNVIQESNDIDASNARGQGISVLYASGSGVQISNNIVANSAADNTVNVRGIILDAQVTGISVTNNVFCNLQNRPAITDNGSGNTVTDNVLNTGNSDTCTGLGFSDPTRTVGSYNAQIPGCASLPGGCTATLDAFLTSAKAQSKDNWNTSLMACSVNDYIRAGFDKTLQGC